MEIKLLDLLVKNRIDFKSKVQNYIICARDGEVTEECYNKFDRLAVVSRFITPMTKEIAPKYERFQEEVIKVDKFHSERLKPAFEKLISLENQLDKILVEKDYSGFGDLQKIFMPFRVFHFDNFNSSSAVIKGVYDLSDISSEQLEKTKGHISKVKEDTEKLYTNHEYQQKVIKKGYCLDFFDIYDQLIPLYEELHKKICEFELQLTNLLSLNDEYNSLIQDASIRLRASFRRFQSNHDGWIAPAIQDSLDIIVSDTH